MLNRFKIGTKLFGGFAIVLVLLIAVWLTGLYATTQIITQTKELDAATKLAQDGQEMQKEIGRALIAAANEALYKDEQYAKEVQRIMANIKETNTNNDVVGRIINPDTKRLFGEVMDAIDRFADSDKKYWDTEVERDRIDKQRDSFSQKTIESIGELANLIMKVTQENPEFVVTRDDNVFYDAKRVELIANAGELSDHVRDINTLGLAYQLASEDGKKDVMDAITETRRKIAAAIELIRPSLSTPAGDTALQKFNDNLVEWRGATNKMIDLVDELLIIDAATTKIADEMNGKIIEMLGRFHTRAETAVNDATDIGTTMQLLLAIISIIAVIVGAVLALVLSNNITAGLKRAVGAMTTIADEGNVSIELSSEDARRADEVGDMAKALRNILQQFQNVERLANSLADGNYDIETKVRGNLDTMNINLNKMLDQVNHVLGEIGEGVKQVATGSNEVSSASQALSSGAQESAASLEEITASMSEISSQTKQNAESAGQARDLAQKASVAATNGQSAMQEMTGAMGRITQNSNEIQRVIKVIDDIAFQTNLLALNAAVEAARAGQHGKGFAVVAEEVRNLASRSAKAAKETSELIAKSGHEIEKGGEVATHTAEVLNTIVEQIKQTTDLVAGIAVASNEQAQGVNQVTIGLQQIDSVTQQNTAAAEESASAASEMSSMAVSLQKQVDQFKLRGQAKKGGTSASYTAPKPAAHAPIAAPKPLPPVVKPPAPAAYKPTAPKPVTGAHPSEPVHDDAWGGGKTATADIHIDLDDKNFGKY